MCHQKLGVQSLNWLICLVVNDDLSSLWYFLLLTRPCGILMTETPQRFKRDYISVFDFAIKGTFTYSKRLLLSSTTERTLISVAVLSNNTNNLALTLIINQILSTNQIIACYSTVIIYTPTITTNLPDVYARMKHEAFVVLNSSKFNGYNLPLFGG